MDGLPPWPLVEDMLRMLVLPAFAGTALVLAVVCAITKSPAARTIGAAVALAAGLAAGNYFRQLLEWWPPDVPAEESIPAGVMARGWAALLPVTMVALVGGLLAMFAAARTHWLSGTGIRLLTAAGCLWWLTEALTPWTETRTFIVMLTGTVLSWEALCYAAGHGACRRSLIGLTILWGSAAAAVLIFAHSARFCDLAVLMVAGMGGAGLIGILWKVELTPLFAAPAVYLPALLLGGAVNTYSEVPVEAFATVAFAPCGLWLMAIPALQRLPTTRALSTAAVLAVMIPCAVGVVMAARAEDLNFDM